MIECEVCSAKSQLHLCNRCTTDLRAMLAGLARGEYVRTGSHGRTGSGGRWWIERRTPGWLEFLEDAALGRTRLGESARRSSDLTMPLPVNLSASALLQQVHNCLARWVQELCESHGVEVPL